LADPEVGEGVTITLLADVAQLRQVHRQLQLVGCHHPLADPDRLRYLSPQSFSAGKNRRAKREEIQPGQPNAISGNLSFLDLHQAIAATLAGQFQGIVTGPISKAAWQQAGHSYPGQTELLAEMAATSRYGMMFVAVSPHTGWILRMLLATTHIPLTQVSPTLNPGLMSQKLELLIQTLRTDFGLEQPKIAIAGLNPHSGEQGQLGTEEQTWLIPWLEQQRSHFPQLELVGPVPPDTLWVHPGQAWFGFRQEGGTPKTTPADAYLALYHDQGLIPVKLMGFDRAVNTTIGLPFVRTSPDHGTAFDIAGQGIADPTSMKAALHWAAKLVRQRQTLLRLG
jgi:4-hydroxythreonine-4-phosphate dehydrogenase